MTGSSGLSGISTLNNINHLTDSERLATTGVSVDEDALSWFQWTEVRESFISLDDFKRLLLRFRPFQEGGLCTSNFLRLNKRGWCQSTEEDSSCSQHLCTGCQWKPWRALLLRDYDLR